MKNTVPAKSRGKIKGSRFKLLALELDIFLRSYAKAIKTVPKDN